MAKKSRDSNEHDMRDVAGEENAAVGSQGGDMDTDRSIDPPGLTGNGVGEQSAADDAKKPKKTIDEKRADFGRLASGRVSRAIDALSALQHLSNTSSYDWSDEAQVKIFE